MNFKIFLKKNSPKILTGLGIVGLVGTVVSAVCATPKAQKILQEKEEEKGEALTTSEKVKYAGPVYIPTALTGLATAACIIGAGTANNKKIASISGGYALLADQYKRYQGKVKEKFGIETHREIMEEITVEPCDPPTLTACGITDSGFDIPETDSKCLFYDTLGERYFEARYADVLCALYHLNRNYALGGVISVCEYFDFLGLDPDKRFDELGWSFYGGLEWIDFDITKTTTDDGLVFFMLSPTFYPWPDFETC